MAALCRLFPFGFARNVWCGSCAQPGSPCCRIEPVGIPLPAGNITIQLSGEGGGFYTSEHFACVKENGDQLSYAFQNNGTEACYVSLYKVGLLGGYKKVTESILIQPGETGHGSYEDPGNETYCIRISSQFGGGIYGTLDAVQTVYLTSNRE